MPQLYVLIIKLIKTTNNSFLKIEERERGGARRPLVQLANAIRCCGCFCGMFTSRLCRFVRPVAHSQTGLARLRPEVRTCRFEAKRCFASASAKYQGGLFDVIEFDTNGDFLTRTMNKHALVQDTGLWARDLIVLDSGFHRRPRPVILVRESSIVLSLAFIRAIVRHDKIFLFHPSHNEVNEFAVKLGEFLKGKRAPFLPHVVLGGTSQAIQDDFLPVWVDDKKFGHDSSYQQLSEVSGNSSHHCHQHYPSSELNQIEHGGAFELKALEGILSQVCRL